MKKPHLAIILPLNDYTPADRLPGTSTQNSSVNFKSKKTYGTLAGLFSYSLNKNWIESELDFTWEVYVIYNQYLAPENLNILSSLPKTHVIKVDYPAPMLRPVAYTMDIECDFRLVCDSDIIAINPTTFDFTLDAAGTVGSNNWPEYRWLELSESIGSPLEEDKYHYPCTDCTWDIFKASRQLEETVFNMRNGHIPHAGPDGRPMFPYFNNGCIFIRDSISLEVGELWQTYRVKLSEATSKKKGAVGQYIIGLAIADTTDNWGYLTTQHGIINDYRVRKNFGKINIKSLQPVPSVGLLHYIGVRCDSTSWYGRCLNDIWDEFTLKYCEE